jgi:hypothetical protein
MVRRCLRVITNQNKEVIETVDSPARALPAPPVFSYILKAFPPQDSAGSGYLLADGVDKKKVPSRGLPRDGTNRGGKPPR